MIHVPNMFLIGAAHRNVGKTEFACSLIKRLSSNYPVYAVKVTPVESAHGECPRGGKGCGVCSSLDSDYCLTEEDIDASGGLAGKDTQRMKEAGAVKVLWLRVLRSRMEDGVSALLARIPKGACIVCESNTVRSVIDPGYFMIIQHPASSQAAKNAVLKETCARVMHLADRYVAFHGDHWDISPDSCVFDGQVWRAPLDVSIAILAGRKSSRMGENKSLLKYGQSTVLEHTIGRLGPFTDDLLIGAGSSNDFSFLKLRVVKDEKPDCGPLMGILSCLEQAQHEKVFFSACDILDIPFDVIRLLVRESRGCDIVMPLDSEGRPEPLMAVYSRNAIAAIRKALSAGKKKVTSILDPDLAEEFGLVFKMVTLQDLSWYSNINTRHDYEKAVYKKEGA